MRPVLKALFIPVTSYFISHSYTFAHIHSLSIYSFIHSFIHAWFSCSFTNSWFARRTYWPLRCLSHVCVSCMTSKVIWNTRNWSWVFSFIYLRKFSVSFLLFNNGFSCLFVYNQSTWISHFLYKQFSKYGNKKSNLSVPWDPLLRDVNVFDIRPMTATLFPCLSVLQNTELFRSLKHRSKKQNPLWFFHIVVVNILRMPGGKE